MTDSIQLFVPKFRIPECLAQIQECLEKGWTGLGYKTVEFEKAWCEYTGLPHSHFVNSATSGLHLAVKLLKDQYGWRPGDEIITTPLTFVSTNHVILYEHLTPVFADVGKYLCLDPLSVEKHIAAKTRAVMFVGLGGNAGQLDAIRELCKYYGLALILDAAHMSGTLYNGEHVGSEADISVFSFQAVKNLPTADSGMLCCKDPELDARARRLTWMGIDKDTYSRTYSQGSYKWYYDVGELGYKYHSNSIMAALGLVGLRYLDEDNVRRREICFLYDKYLMGSSGIERIPISPFCIPSRHLYQVMVEDRDNVMRQLNEANIFPGVHYRDNRAYQMYAPAEIETCPRASYASEHLISLPLHLNLSNEDVKRVARELTRIVENGQASCEHSGGMSQIASSQSAPVG